MSHDIPIAALTPVDRFIERATRSRLDALAVDVKSLRTFYRRRAGLCRCGRERPPGKKMCSVCRARSSPISSTRSTYIIGWERLGPLKIGKARDITHRLADLQSASPFELRVFDSFAVDIETHLRRELDAHAIRGEWFQGCAQLWRVVEVWHRQLGC